MKEAACLRGATVFVDGFSEFSDPERRMLVRLGRLCERVEVTLLMDAGATVDTATTPDELQVLHRVGYTCQKLLKACVEEGTAVGKAVLMKDGRRYATEELRMVEQRMAGEQVRMRTGRDAGPTDQSLTDRNGCPTEQLLTDRNVCPTGIRRGSSDLAVHAVLHDLQAP